MLNSRESISIGRVLNLLAFDVIVGIALTWLIVDSPRRWPILLVIVPLLLLVNFWLGKRALGARKTASYALPVIYLCGLVFSIAQVIEEFTWWRLTIVFLPLILLIVSIRAVKRQAGGSDSGVDM